MAMTFAEMLDAWRDTPGSCLRLQPCLGWPGLAQIWRVGDGPFPVYYVPWQTIGLPWRHR